MDYLVVVPGTVKGATVHAKITNISAKTAFAQRTTENTTR
jgi:predicted RNA-binding protein with TRAM domain